MSTLMSLINPATLLLCFFGCFFGILIGALPGMGPAMGVALVLPFAVKLSPLRAILMLLCVYQGAEYGGSITAILLNIPGTPSAAATVLDGNAMARKGQPGQAIRYSLVSSCVGGLVAAFALAFLTEPIGRFSLIFSAPDLFMLGLIACFGIIMLATENAEKGFVAICLGFMISTVGTDMFTGGSRYTYGNAGLLDGMDSIAIVVAVFAIPEMFCLISESLQIRYVTDTRNMNSRMCREDYRRIAKPVGIGSVLGTVIGIFPALGGAMAAWMSYILTKKTSKRPELFGTGIPEGIAAPESANNATVGASLIPMLSLGIPGSTPTALIGAALTMFGLKVGPSLFTSEPELLDGIYYGFFLSVIALYILGRLLTPFFSRVLVVENAILVPVILIFTIVGTYANDKDFLNLWVALVFGTVFFLLKLADYPLAPLCVSFILGPTVEKNFRRALDLSGGKVSIFWESTCSKVILALLAVTIMFPIMRAALKKIKENTKKQ